MHNPIAWLPPHHRGEFYQPGAIMVRQPQWWSMQYKADEWWAKGVDGTGVVVVVVDTGGDKQHPDLDGQIIAQVDATGEGVADGNAHGCIAPDDVIYTSLCGTQPIKTFFERVGGIAHFLQDGSIVKDTSRLGIHTLSLGADGKMHRRKVLAAHKLPYRGTMRTVEVVGKSKMHLTPWHPVYQVTSSRGTERTIRRRRADELNVGDIVALSSVGPGVTDELIAVPSFTYWQCRFCGYRAAGGKRPQCKKCNRHAWHDGAVQESVVLDEDAAFFLGLVITDGHLMQRQKSIEFTNNSQRLHEVFASLSASLFGRTPRRYAYRRCETSRLNSRKAWNWCHACGIQVGAKSLTMRFPELIAKSPRRVIMAFLAGMIEGNGCVSRNKIRLVSGSKEMADGIKQVCEANGIRASIALHHSPKSHGPSYCIGIGASPELAARAITKKLVRPVAAKARGQGKITRIVESEYDGDVYDLTVEEDHNYVANGCIVSNTHCSGIIAAKRDGAGVCGIAPGAKIVTAKGLTNAGSGSSKTLADAYEAGCKAAFDAGAKVVLTSNSYGGSGRISQLDSVAAKWAAKGVIAFAAAGNDGTNNGVDYPAKGPLFAAIGAHNEARELASFSDRGPEVDCVAPGVQILSTVPGGGWQKFSGTSMATPASAAFCALRLSAELKMWGEVRTKTLAQYIALLAVCCDDGGPAGRDNGYGFGFVNLDRLLSLDVSPPPDNTLRRFKLEWENDQKMEFRSKTPPVLKELK